jgi:hypothetical protein
MPTSTGKRRNKGAWHDQMVRVSWSTVNRQTSGLQGGV